MIKKIAIGLAVLVVVVADLQKALGAAVRGAAGAAGGATTGAGDALKGLLNR